MATMQQIFDRVLEMPSISKVVQELLVSFNDPNANVDEITKRIRMDQALSAKVLRLANSVRYGSGRKISTIDSAVVMLGFSAVKTLVVASGVTGAFRTVPHLDMKAYWRETFLIANVCKYIAKQAKLDAETAFTCGLMHSVGEILLYMADGKTMQEIEKLVQEGQNRLELEVKHFGFNYAQVGEELAKRWNFPDNITRAIEQHTLSTEKTPDPYALVVYAARLTTQACLMNASKEEQWTGLPDSVTSALRIDTNAVLNEVSRLLNQEDDIDQVLAA